MAASTANIPTVPCEIPNRVKTPGNQEGISSDDGTDSGYATREGSRISDTNTPVQSDSGKFLGFSISFPFPSRKLEKKGKIPFLDLAIDPSATERFVGIQPHFEKLLLEHVSKSQKRGARLRPMSTRLLMIGQTKEDAVAEIAIFCHREQHPSIKLFAKQKMITEMCQPSISGQQPFNITVIPEAPRLRIMFINSMATVVGDHALLDRWESTLCGARILLQSPFGQSRKATCGGLIKVVMENGEIYFYGTTAGHVLHDLYDRDDTSSVNARTDDGYVGNDDVDEDDDDDDDDDDEEFEIDLAPFRAQSRTNTPPLSSPTELNAWEFEKLSIIGQMIEPDTILNDATKAYDWALFKLHRAVDFGLNKVPVDAMDSLFLSNSAPKKTEIRSVFMIVGRTVKKGSLSSSSGRILVGPSQVFVDAYTITIDDENGICDGDSGSWVVDSETFELYGHLVASDIFNSGYVIPISQVFDDIQHQLGARSVGIPNAADIYCLKEYLRSGRLPLEAVEVDISVRHSKAPLESGYASKDTNRQPIYPQYPREEKGIVDIDSGYSSINTSLEPTPRHSGI